MVECVPPQSTAGVTTVALKQEGVLYPTHFPLKCIPNQASTVLLQQKDRLVVNLWSQYEDIIYFLHQPLTVVLDRLGLLRSTSTALLLNVLHHLILKAK